MCLGVQYISYNDCISVVYNYRWSLLAHDRTIIKIELISESMLMAKFQAHHIMHYSNQWTVQI